MDGKPISALRFDHSISGGTPAQSTVDCSSPEAFQRSVALFYPAVYVVSVDSLKAFEALKGVFAPLKKKNVHKGISTCFRNRRNVPLVEASYTSSVRLEQGLRGYLSKARDKKHADVAVLGVSRKVFQELWLRAQEDSNQMYSKDGKPTGFSGDLEEGHLSTEAILGLFDSQKVPEELKRIYIGDSAEAELVRVLIMRAAKLGETPVLITGPTGTGKELVARNIHKYSPRSNKDFLPINCSAVPTELLESELFGHEAGAFTGATTRKTGLLEMVGEGTVFLDEIGDLPVEQQPKLLRVIEERKFRTVGGTKMIGFHGRIIAATNRNLFSMIETKAFREDLYYRLCQFTIFTPAIGTHREDILQIVEDTWNSITKGTAPSLPKEIQRTLAERSWPGNVRQIKATLTKLHTLFGGQALKIDHLRAAIQLMEGQMERPHPDSEFVAPSVKLQCLQHLKDVAESVRNCKAMFRVLSRADNTGGKSVKSLVEKTGWHWQQLDTLCGKPHLFHSAKVFRAVHRLKSQLAQFGELLTRDAEAAARFYREMMEDQFEATTEALVTETGRIIDRI